jgi:hypothetical protein
MIGDVSARLVGQFADCLAGRFAEAAPTEPAAAPPPPDGAATPGTPVPPVRVPPSSPGTAAAQRSPWEAEPIDLLAVTDAGAAVRRALPYVATAIAGLLVLAGLIRWARRSRPH